MLQMQKLTSYFTSKKFFSVYTLYFIFYNISAPVYRYLRLLVFLLNSCILQSCHQIRGNQGMLCLIRERGKTFQGKLGKF